MSALRSFGVAAGFSAVATIASGAIAAEAAKRQFDLPADAAEQSLKRFSTQSGLQLVFASEITDGVRTNPVKGDFTPMEAADRLLAGTPLRVTSDNKTGVLSVTRKPGPEMVPPGKKKAPISTAITTSGKLLSHDTSSPSKNSAAARKICGQLSIPLTTRKPRKKKNV